MDSKKTLSPFTKTIWWLIILIIISCISFVFYIDSEKKISKANELQLRSFILADELRHSSDNLTLMVRTYVATKNPLYKAHYQEILDIRNGKKTRPIGYQNIYWDLVGLDDKRPRPYSNRPISLIESMKKAGFTKNEFSKLSESKNNSDALTQIEFAAMNLVEIKGSALEIQLNKQKALKLLYDENYHKAKVSIMQPIDEFYRMMNKRTNDVVKNAKKIAFYLRIAFIAIVLLVFLMLLHLHKTLYRILGSSVDTLYTHIANIAKGDFSVEILIKQGLEDSVLGWLKKHKSN